MGNKSASFGLITFPLVYIYKDILINSISKYYIKKAGHKVYMLSRARQYVNTNTALTIFKSMILPYIEYGNIFYGTCNEIYKHKLQVIQNNALKIALNKNNLYSTVDLHIEAKILPCKYRGLMMLQKITFNEVKENVALVHKKDIRTRAHDGILLYAPLPKTELFTKSNCYNKPVIWKNLPTQIRCINELDEFKSQIKRYYIRMFLSDYNYYTITYW